MDNPELEEIRAMIAGAQNLYDRNQNYQAELVLHIAQARALCEIAGRLAQIAGSKLLNPPDTVQWMKDMATQDILERIS